ncbi:MAG: DinB family protein [Promethearchaeota archaeon]
MERIIIGLSKQLDYMKKVLSDRDIESFDISLKSSLFPEEPSALEIYIHGVSSLFWVAQKLLFPDKDDQEFALAIDPDSAIPLKDQMVDLYKKAIEALTEYLGTITDAELMTKIPSPFGGGEMVLLDWLGINIHHTIGHVAQALRLQSLYLRHETSIQ